MARSSVEGCGIDAFGTVRAAGWTIERFDALVGRTRLMLSR